MSKKLDNLIRAVDNLVAEWRMENVIPNPVNASTYLLGIIALEHLEEAALEYKTEIALIEEKEIKSNDSD